MLEFLAKALPIFLTAIIVPIVIGWLKGGSGNSRNYIFIGILILFGLALVVIDLGQKEYAENDYTTRQVVVRKCLKDKLGNGIIVAEDDSEYPFNRSLLRRVGSAPELANRLCHQRKLKLWLDPRNEISAFEGEDFSIPIEVGIINDNGEHGLLAFGLTLSILLSVFLIILFLYNKKREKININLRK
jgi:hypothetical protein